MHEHDLDLIGALAEERLEPAEATVAAAAIEGCSRCRADLEAQRIALAAIRNAPAPRLTDLERARLHRRVWAQTDEEAPAAAQAAAARPLESGRRAWRRLSAAVAVAAALAVFVAVGGILTRGGVGQFTAEGDSADTTTAAAEVAQAPTTAALQATGGAPEEVPAAPAAPDAEEFTDTESAARESSALVLEPSEVTIEELQALAATDPAVADEAKTWSVAGSLYRSAVPALCWEQAAAAAQPGGAPDPAYLEFAATLDGTPVEVFAFAMPDEHVVVAIDAETCDVVHVATAAR